MGQLWNQKGYPHKGWSCTGMEDLGSADGSCEMCGKEEIRYVHFMEHPEVECILSVGCICAEKMESERGAGTKAKARERSMRNAAGRRGRWADLRGWKISKRGNAYIEKNGSYVVVFAHGPRFKFRIERKAKEEIYFSKRSYANVREAKLAAFDAITYLADEDVLDGAA